MAQPPKRRARLNKPELFPLVTEEHAAAIGFVAMRWSDVENALAHLIGQVLLKLGDHAGKAITAEMPHLPQVNLATTLISLAGEDDWESAWKAITTELDRLRPGRNFVIHAEWQRVGEYHHAYRVQAKGRIKQRFPRVETEEVDQLAEECLMLAERIMKFCHDVTTDQTRPHIAELISLPFPPWLTRNQPPTPTTRAQPQAPSRPRLSSAQKRAAKAIDPT